MENVTLKERLDGLFNIACEHGIHHTCSGYNDENDSLIVGFKYDFKVRSDDGDEVTYPIECSYSLDATKRKELKAILMENGIDEEDTLDIMKAFLLKRSIDLLYSNVPNEENNSDVISENGESVQNSIDAFIVRWCELLFYPSGEAIKRSLFKFKDIEPKVVSAVLHVTIGTPIC